MSMPALLVAVLLAGATPADPASLPFPMRPSAGTWELDAARTEALAARDRVTLHGVPWTEGESVSVDLERLHVLDSQSVFVVNDRPVPARAVSGDVQLWAGVVSGEPGSDVFLAFAPTGTRGWVRRGDAQTHLMVEDDGTGRAVTRFVMAESLTAQGIAPRFTCGTTTPGGKPLPALPAGAKLAAGPALPASLTLPAAPPGTSGVLPLLECHIAFETDTQYTAQFGGDWVAAADYLVSLLGSVSARYREQIGIAYTITYGVFYPVGPDPWTTQETGGDGIDLLWEFIHAWEGGAAPVASDVYFFMSGATLLPSVGAFEGICSPDWAFALGRGMDGSTPFPIAQGPLTWNYTTMAHELGHVFGAEHTHDYCPPIDQCSPAFGPCQTQQVCQTDGTLMSYCVNCPGGAGNYTTLFHPFLVDVIREYAEQKTCLQPYVGSFDEDLGHGLAGSTGTPSLETSFDTGAHALLLEYADAPASATAGIILGASSVEAPFKGGTLVPDPLVVLVLTTPAQNDYDISASVPTSPSYPDGVDLYLQTWFVDAGGPKGFSATNGLRTELVVPDPLPAPVWIAHPSNGNEYALSHVGTYGTARAQALAAGGDLVSVDDALLNLWLVQTFGVGGLRSAYIGLSDAAIEGSFVWEDGSPIPLTLWSAGQPNDDSASGQDVVELLLQSVILTHEEGDPAAAAGQWNDTLPSGWFTNRGIMERAAGP
jgi:hypothetical protein